MSVGDDESAMRDIVALSYLFDKSDVRGNTGDEEQKRTDNRTRELLLKFARGVGKVEIFNKTMAERIEQQQQVEAYSD